MVAGQVLVVEDNMMNMELELALLEQAGCIAIQATSAEEGIALAKTRQPSLILMDVSLPGMDGLTALRILKQDSSTKDIPIVVLTAHAMRDDEAKAKQAGCDGYLTKPINTREFLQVVTHFMAPHMAPLKAPEHNDAVVNEVRPASKSILVVDDDQVNRDLMEGLLESLGHQSESVHDGVQALNRLEVSEQHRMPDLILLDAMMPGMNGFEVARVIRQTPAISDLPIIMVTALTSREDRLRAVESGANDFITKPIDKTELRVRLTSLLKMKEAQDAIKQHRLELEELVQQRTHELHRALTEVTTAREEADQAHRDTIYRLAVASEYKDKDTATHIQRVSNYCGLLARHLQLPEHEIATLCAASPMHDLGKIGIPDSILLKPGKLDPDEWAIMKEHTSIGARIMRGSSSNLLQAGQVIALSHHEKWDGSGYPQGLYGPAIPRWGRICAIADVFDALTNERPYKKAFTNQEAFEIMYEGRGKHFDPEMLDLFLMIRDEILAIQRQSGPVPR